MQSSKPSNTNPAISVILPVYNGGAYLIESVQSVLKQNLLNFEFLILDDCSTDGSFSYLESIIDDRVSLFKNDVNKGLFYNLNFLIGKCKSPLIKLWSQDDIMYPNCLRSFTHFHNLHPGIGFSYSQRDIIDNKGKVREVSGTDLTPEIVSPELHARIAYFTGSIAGNIANVCLSRDAVNSVALFRDDMKISADFDMWVRLARDHQTGHINEKLIQLRDHEGQLSRNESLYIYHLREDLEVYRYLNTYVTVDLKAEGKKLLRRHKLVFYYTLMMKALAKGKIKTAWLFLKELAGYDNFFILSSHFLKSKIGKPYKGKTPNNIANHV
ncbi:MAG: glycosyltransferase [Ferruginibacter sp.]